MNSRNHRYGLGAAVIALVLVAAACSDGADAAAEAPAAGSETTTTAGNGATTAPTTAAPITTTGDSTPETPEASGLGTPDGSAPERLAPFTGAWTTDWSSATVDLGELQVGIAAPDPRDRIPPIDEPVFEDVAAGASWLEGREPGLLYEFGEGARFYPLSILTRHEIVNDEADRTPIAVTYCPLCNTGVVFDRRVDGETHRFGVSGLLRNSDLVMWDDVTESLWQQITGQAIVGELAGTRLAMLPSSLVSFGDFAEAFPDGEVLSRDTGFDIPYGSNPYAGYSTSVRPFLFDGELDDRFAALERVVGVTIGDDAAAYPFLLLEEVRAVNDEVGGVPITVLWGAPDTADALDTSQISAGRAIGTGVAYSREVDGQILTFVPAGEDRFTDEETGTTWTLLGTAIDGPLAGTDLETVVHRNEFWFAWHAFFPEGRVVEG